MTKYSSCRGRSILLAEQGLSAVLLGAVAQSRRISSATMCVAFAFLYFFGLRPICVSGVSGFLSFAFWEYCPLVRFTACCTSANFVGCPLAQMVSSAVRSCWFVERLCRVGWWAVAERTKQPLRVSFDVLFAHPRPLLIPSSPFLFFLVFPFKKSSSLLFERGPQTGAGSVVLTCRKAKLRQLPCVL